MSVGMLEPRVKSMARAKGRPKTSERDDVTVRLDRGIVAKLKVVAARQEVSLAELLTEMVREAAERLYLKTVQDMAAEATKPRPKGGKG